MPVAQKNTLVELNEDDLDVVVGGASQTFPNFNINIDVNIVDIIQIGKINQVNGNVFFGKK